MASTEMSVLSKLASYFPDDAFVAVHDETLLDISSSSPVDADVVVHILQEVPPSVLEPLNLRQLPPLTSYNISDCVPLLNDEDAFGVESTEKRSSHEKRKNGLGCDDNPAVLLFSNEESQLGYRALVRELCLLITLTQRPKQNFQWSLNYNNLMRALESKNVQHVLLDGMEQVWGHIEKRQLVHRSASRLLMLYCDAALLYYQHCSTSEADDKAFFSSAQLSQVYVIAQKLSEVTSSREVQRCGVVLTCLLVQNVQAVPLPALEAAAAAFHQRKDRGAASDLVVVASVSHYLQMASGECESWLQTAFSVVFHTTVYGLNLSIFFFRDGAHAPLLRAVKLIVGEVYESLWASIGNHVWRYFSAPALLAAAKSMGMYAFSWQSAPVGLYGLLQHAHFNCNRYSPKLQAASPAEGRRTLKSSALKGALIASSSHLSDVGAAASAPSASAPDAEEDEPHPLASALSFASSQDQALFFLAINNFCTAALAHLVEHVDDLRRVFFWEAPASSSPHGTRLAESKANAAVGGMQREHPQAALASAEGPAATSSNTYHGSQSAFSVFEAKWRDADGRLNLLAQSVDLLSRWASGDDVGHRLLGSSEMTTQAFRSGAVSLLNGLLTSFPFEVSRINVYARHDMLRVCAVVCMTHLRSPAHHDAYVQEMIYSLTERFSSAMGPAVLVASQLLPRAQIARMEANVDAADDALLQLYLYTRLYEKDGGESGVSAQRLLTVLCETEPGTLLRSVEGGVFYLHALRYLHQVILGRLEVTIEALLTEAPLSAQQLVARLVEGTVFLLRELQAGNVFFCNAPTATALELSFNILAEVVRATNTLDFLADCVVSPVAKCNGGHPLAASFVWLSVLFNAGVSYELQYASAELLGALLEDARVRCSGLFNVIRAQTLQSVRHRLAKKLCIALKHAVGAPANILRLKVLRVMQVLDAALFYYLVGYDSVSSSSPVADPSNLPLTQVLCEIVLSQKAAYLERAPATDILRGMGAVSALQLQRVLLITEELRYEHSYEAAALLAAAIYFVNAVLANQMELERVSASGEKETGATAGRGATSTPKLSHGGPACSTSGVSSRSSIVSTYHETIIKILKTARVCLKKSRQSYEVLSKQVFYIDRSQSSVMLQDTSAMFPQALSLSPMVAGGDQLINVSRTPSGTLTLNSIGAPNTQSAAIRTQQLSRILWDHEGGGSAASTVGSTAGQGPSDRHPYSTDALPDLPAVEEQKYRRLYPLVLGKNYCFCGTERDFDFNEMVSITESVGTLCGAVEQLMWIVGGDTGTYTRPLSAAVAVLEAVTRCILISGPSAPVMSRPLWRFLNQCFSLASTITSVVECSGWENLETEVLVSFRATVLRLVPFVHVNARHVDVVSGCLSIFRGVQLTTLDDLSGLERVFAVIARVLKEHVRAPVDESMDTFVDRAALFFERFGLASCSLLYLQQIVAAGFDRAYHLAGQIELTGPAQPAVLHFAKVLRCLRIIIRQSKACPAACFLPEAELVAMLTALSTFGVSVQYDVATQTHQRYGWHVAWGAMLELSHAILCAGEGSEAGVACTASWVVALRAALCASPRFLLALGGFTTSSSDAEAGGQRLAQSGFFVWDVQEVDLCTRLAAVFAALGASLANVLPAVRRCFCLVHRYRLLELCVASTSSVATASAEGRVIDEALVRIVRNQLSFMMLQPTHDVALPGQSVAVEGFTLFEKTKGAATAVAFTAELSFDMLRRFITHELHLIRRATTAEVRSPESAPSRESSANRSPSMTGGFTETESMTDRTQLPESTASIHANSRHFHVDSAQLALGLFILAAEEALHGGLQARGATSYSTFQRELRHSSEKLLYALVHVKKDIRHLQSPKLTTTVNMMTLRLQVVVKALEM